MSGRCPKDFGGRESFFEEFCFGSGADFFTFAKLDAQDLNHLCAPLKKQTLDEEGFERLHARFTRKEGTDSPRLDFVILHRSPSQGDPAEAAKKLQERGYIRLAETHYYAEHGRSQVIFGRVP